MMRFIKFGLLKIKPMKTKSIVFLLTLAILTSCKKDEDQPSISASNFSISIDENPTSGQTLGAISVNGEGYDNLNFYFDPRQGGIADHINLDANGVLTISNPSYFDYEQRTSVSGNGIVEAFNSNDDMATASFSITIQIRDVNEQPAGGTQLSVQARLDTNETPISLYNSNYQLLDSLYGMNYEGGIIAYLDTMTGTGLIVAISDLGNTMPWDPNSPSGGFLQTFDTLDYIGSGSINTAGIVAALGAGTYAAKACEDLVLNSKSDWFLPSLDEQSEIWKNLHNKGKGNFANAVYWTSTESVFSPNQAWKSDFSNPSTIANAGASKNDAYLVRPARAF